MGKHEGDPETPDLLARLQASVDRARKARHRKTKDYPCASGGDCGCTGTGLIGCPGRYSA